MRHRKDSWRMAEAGAPDVAVVGAGRVAFLGDLQGLDPEFEEPNPRSLALILFPRADLVLAEGFTRSHAPCVEVRGPAEAGALAEFLLESLGLRPRRAAACAPGTVHPTPAGVR
ncbi:MAG: molybdopterin-guanine dinucleotide biosynthesis protein MobB [Acidobacteria bacterium]|nr:molybdopterin-guanine dinucleotide biosynthesis protein MobB [Acidobacteriota bacterium]